MVKNTNRSELIGKTFITISFKKQSIYFYYKIYEFVRPDFLLEADSLTPKVCEINARFPLNGFLVTYFGSKFANNYSESFDEDGKHFNSIHSTRQVDSFLGNYFDLRKPIGILKKREVSLASLLIYVIYHFIIYLLKW
jgi:hypothetical protein